MTDLILIPALGCDARLYAEMVPMLPRNIRPTTVIPNREHFDGCVEQVLAAAPEQFAVLGTSFGARVAMELALAAPDRLQGLVVIGAGPGPVVDPNLGRRRSERLRGGEFEAVVGEMADIISHLDGPNGAATRQAFKAMARTQGAAFMARQSDALAMRIDLWPRIAEIACPSLMLWGVHDQFSPAGDGLRMSAGVQRGRYVELADCGHFPSLEYPEETSAAISHWLTDCNLT